MNGRSHAVHVSSSIGATALCALLAMLAFTPSIDGARAATMPQSIAFTQPADRIFGTPPFSVIAAATSGLGVTIATRTATVCAVSAKSITVLSAGTCTLRASQPGNTTYFPAATVDRSFNISKASQTISFVLPASAVYGGAALTMTASANSGLAVALASTTPPVCTVSAKTLAIVAAGNCIVHASQAGNANYNAATALDRSLKVSKAAQTIAFAALVARTFSTSPFGLTATASSKLPVAYSSATPAVCSVGGSSVTLVAAGTCSVRAAQAGNANFNAAPTVTQSFAIAKAKQAIVFAAIAGHPLGDAPFGLVATASSNLPVTFASTTSAVCRVSGPMLTALAAGTCTIRASQAGSTSYAAAADVLRSFVVAKGPQTITFSAISDHVFADPPITLSAASSSALAVTFASVTPSICGVTASTATIVGTGTCTIRASQAGNASFAAAATVDRSFAIARATQSIVFASIAARTFGDAPFTVDASSSAALPVTLTLSTPAVCGLSGATVAILAAGVCTLRASQAGDSHFAAAAPVERSVTIGKANQSIAFASPGPHSLNDPPFPIVAVASSNLPVSFSSASASICAVAGSTVTLLHAGDCRIDANQAGNANVNAAPATSQVFQALPAMQAITFDAIAEQSLAASPVAARAVASSGLPVLLASQTPAQCSLTGSQVTLIATGTCTVRATQPGNETYPAAAAVDRTFGIVAISQQIDFPKLADRQLASVSTVAMAVASSGLPVRYSTASPAACNTDGSSSVVLVAVGTCVVRASQPGNSRYAPAADVEQRFNVLSGTSRVAFDAIGAQTLAASPLALSASAPSGLQVVFATQTAAVCTVSGAALSLLRPGTCGVSAFESADGVHPQGNPVTQSFAVLRTPVFLPATTIAPGPWTYFALPGRFRGSAGNVDLVVPWQAGIATFTGGGNGTFAAAGNYASGVYPQFGALADFDNDGDLDFAISFIGSQSVDTYLNDGHGAFAVPRDYATVATPSGIAAADLDGDGNPDILVANADSNGIHGQSVTVLTGGGDGTLIPSYAIPVCDGPRHLVVADFNNDAIPDFAVTCEHDNAVAVILHHADGTYDFLPSITGILLPYALAAADLDGDGDVDLVAASRAAVSVVLLNAGNGQFRNAGQLPAGGGDIAIGDFNADGTKDIAVVEPLSNLLSVFAGVGDGSFAPPVVTSTGTYPSGMASADIDGNGSVDLMFATMQDGTATILRNGASIPAVAHVIAESHAQSTPVGTIFADPLSLRVTDINGQPIAGVEVRFALPPGAASATFGNGTRNIDATTNAEGIVSTPRIRAGKRGGSYVAVARAGSVSVDFSLVNQLAGSPPAFTSSAPPTATYGTPYRFALAASGAPLPQFAVASGRLPPGISLTPAGILAGTPVSGGTYTGSFSASNGNAPDAIQAFAITVATSSQTITFNSIPDQPIDARAVSAVAAASSGLPVALQTLAPQVCAAGGSTVQLLHTGRCTVRATQAGSALFAAASPVERSFNVLPGSQIVKLTMPQDPRVFAVPAVVDSSASSGLPVTLSTQTPSICVIVDAAHVNFIARGTCTLTALQAGNADFASGYVTAGVMVRGAVQTIFFPKPHNGRLDEYTYLLASASSGLPINLVSLTPAVCAVVLGNVVGLGNDPNAPGNFCTIRASQPGNETYDAAMVVDVTFPFGFDPNLPQAPPPTPHIVYATYLGGLGRDLTFDIVAAPDGGAFVGGTVGSTNFPKLSSQQFTNAGLDLVFVSKLQSQKGLVDYSVAVGGMGSSLAGVGAVPEIAIQQAMAITPSGEIVVAARPGGADFPQRSGTYIHQGPVNIFKVDAAGHVGALVSLDPAIQTVRALASDKSGAIYATGVAGAGLVTTAGAAIASSQVSSSAPYLLKISPAGSQEYCTYLTVPKSRTGGTHDIGQGKNEDATTPYALTVDGAGNAYVVGQALATDFPVTPGSLDTRDINNRDAFVAKVNASGTAIPTVARIGFRDVDRATAIALEPDGSIVVGGKTASVDDFEGGYSFQTSVHFSQNNQQTLRADREFGFVAQLDPTASRVNFMAAIGSFGGDLIDHAYESAPRPLKISVDPAGYIYVAGTGASDRTLPLMGLLPGIYDEGAFLMKISPNGGQRYSTFLGEGVVTGVAADGFGNAYVSGYSKGGMPTANADQADCTVDNNGNCVTPFVIKVNDAAVPVGLTSPAPSIVENTSTTLTATVGDLRATGVIDFSEDGLVLATVPVVSGHATYTLSPSTGIRHYAATFRGSGYANGMSSPALALIVNQKAAQ